ncbi:hypothetical protein V8046_004781 [Vibrio parahaemolyticus]|uniref:helix-turn-helix transcriptional regulator n=1 Tax=Vibrio diabolicus TaxID=50719 RepID=UPI001D658A9B|nr:hypothetical protein [Vibrio diabolicus]EIA1625486.1 hypothetical protein [Vibrio parahaemolyticus]EIV8636938.1 hypothetical protein [Vibrio parahaemolyticus]EIZ1450640.1 hypothetical protein [Vibrio parahaemolyticus]EJF4460513.1 hypothetical protein [Vibrio parahaemolyticus]EKL0056882.1 hypothetical protein [Vibrio parahaemolyticus]
MPTCFSRLEPKDCTVSSKGNVLVVDFDREANSYEEAVVSAIKPVNSVDGLTVKSVDAGQYVGLSDTAELSQLTRSALSKFSKGERGDGIFPTPYLRVQGKVPLYDWSEIAQWLESRGLVEKGIADNAKITAQLNMELKLEKGELEHVSRLAAIL